MMKKTLTKKTLMVNMMMRKSITKNIMDQKNTMMMKKEDSKKLRKKKDSNIKKLRSFNKDSKSFTNELTDFD